MKRQCSLSQWLASSASLPLEKRTSAAEDQLSTQSDLSTAAPIGGSQFQSPAAEGAQCSSANLSVSSFSFCDLDPPYDAGLVYRHVTQLSDLEK